MADERCDVHLAGFEQADGVFEGERVDEGALNGQLLLIDIVGVHLEVRLLRAHAEHEHLRALLGGGHGLRLGGRQTHGLDDHVIGFCRKGLARGVVDVRDAEQLLVALELLIEDAGQVHLMHAVGLHDLGEELAHEAVSDDQRFLVGAQLQQVHAVHGAGDRFDGGGVLQRDVVRQFVDYGGRCGELFGQTAVTRDAHGGKMVAQFGALGQAVLALTAVDVRIDGHAVAHLDTSDLGTDGGHDAGVLMAEHDRRHGGGRPGAAGVQVVIGATHAGVGGVDQYFVGLDFRSGQVLDFEFLDAGEHKSLHDGSFLR